MRRGFNYRVLGVMPNAISRTPCVKCTGFSFQLQQYSVLWQ